MPVEKKWFLVCPKTGKVIGLNRNYPWARWLFPVVGLAALVWFLVRVIPKPSRAEYPCQRVGAPLALGGLFYFLSLFGMVSAFRRARTFIRQHRYAVAAVCLMAGLACGVVVIHQNEARALAENTGTFTPANGPNEPQGTARGINPGRVAWSYDLSACNWDGTSKYWFSTNFNDQTKITKILNNVICSVAGQSDISNSWDALFRYKNGGAPYVKGEKIAVKLNLNNGGKYSNTIDASPQSVYALLDGLVSQFGADPAAVKTWYAHWMAEGLSGLEAYLAESARHGRYCCGDQVSMADICLVPQIFNAQRFDCDLVPYPITMAIFARCCIPPDN